MAAVKVLVVDDSPIMQKLLVSMLAADNRLQVVGLAANGEECVQKAVQLKPQVILLDLEMPILNGVETLLELSKRNLDVAVLAICDFSQKDSPMLKEALAAGAFDFFVKPKSTMEIDRYQRQVLTKIFVASFTRTKQIPKKGEAPPASSHADTSRNKARKYTVIGCSTGGKNSLATLLPLLNDQCTTSIVIVIQQPAFIVQQFMKEIKDTVKLPFQHVEDGSVLKARQILITPSGNMDLTLERSGEAHEGIVKARFVPPDAKVPNHPCLDAFFQSAAQVLGADCLGVILSGTGKGGVLGLKAIQEAKGLTIVEDKATATVSQLPAAVQAANAADEALPIKGIAQRLNT